jgi:hypothetical protein
MKDIRYGNPDKGHRVKKKNPDGTINKKWLEIYGHSTKRPKGARNSGNDHPETLSDVVDWVDPYEDMI